MVKKLLENGACFVICWCLSFFLTINFVGNVTVEIVVISFFLSGLLCTCCCAFVNVTMLEMNNMQDAKVLPYCSSSI